MHDGFSNDPIQNMILVGLVLSTNMTLCFSTHQTYETILKCKQTMTRL